MREPPLCLHTVPPILQARALFSVFMVQKSPGFVGPVCETTWPAFLVRSLLLELLSFFPRPE